MTEITWHGTKEELLERLRSLPALCAGKGGDATIALPLQGQLGNAFLAKVKQDFLVKSRRGTGEDGITWPELAPSTIESRRKKARKGRGVAGKEFSERVNRLATQLRSDGVDAGTARKQAEKVIRSTIKDTDLPILQDAGPLLASLEPGVENVSSGAQHQVFDTSPGQVRVGVDSDGKWWHHRGAQKGKWVLPPRPFWPPTGDLPPSWWDELFEAARRGLVKVIERLLAR